MEAELVGILNKKPEWRTGVFGAGTPGGAGVPLSLLALVMANPGLIALDIVVANYVVGDSAVITIEKQIDAINWRVVGYIEVVNGNVITVFGSPCFIAAAIPATTLEALSFLYYSDSAENLAINVNQTVGVMRQVEYRYNILDELN